MNYPDSVRFLYSLGNELKPAKFDLERISRLLERLGNPHRAGRFVHVAGTNGKGSTCAMIESALRAAGLRTGLYTSPHLMEPTERIQIDRRPVSPEQFAAVFDRVHEAANDMEPHPSYFETVTAMAFLIFAGERVNFTVLEVGLGGRLDATNVMHPELSVITPVDFDHEAWLGKSLDSIAGEKAGILKAGVPAAFAAQRPESAAVLDRCAAELGIRVVRAADRPVEDLRVNKFGSTFKIEGMPFECGLAGAHQVENARTAIAALTVLGIENAAIQHGIKTARWPGRLERISKKPEIIVDGAHNPAGARALAAYVQQFYGHRTAALIYGGMRDKAVEEIAGILFPLFGEVIVTAPRQSRALSVDTYGSLTDHAALTVAKDLTVALARVRGSRRPVFITGSLFLVAEAFQLLGHP